MSDDKASEEKLFRILCLDGAKGFYNLSRRGEEIASVAASLFSPAGRRWPPTGLASGTPEDRLRGRMRGSFTQPNFGSRLPDL